MGKKEIINKEKEKEVDVKSMHGIRYRATKKGEDLADYRPMLLEEDHYDFVHQMLCSMGRGSWTLKSLKAMWKRDIRAMTKESRASTWNSFKQQTLTDMIHWMQYFDDTFVALANDGFIERDTK